MRVFALLTLSLLSLVYGQNSKYLLLESRNQHRQILLKPGEHVHFQGAVKSLHYRGVLKHVSDSSVVLTQSVWVPSPEGQSLHTTKMIVPLEDIHAVFVLPTNSWFRFRSLYYRTAITSGSLIIGGSSMRTLVDRENPEPLNFIFATAMMTSAVVMRYLGKYRYNVDKRWNLRVSEEYVEFDNELLTEHRTNLNP
ncbi:MAG: hypothetical protein AAFR59_15925 [Bacteroidota bacterium]